MSATRTQVYLTSEQRRRIDEIVARDDTTLAEVVRKALDRYLGDSDVDVERALAETLGSDPDARPPLRDEWTRE